MVSRHEMTDSGSKVESVAWLMTAEVQRDPAGKLTFIKITNTSLELLEFREPAPSPRKHA